MVLEEKSNVARRKFIYSGISKKNTSYTIALKNIGIIPFTLVKKRSL